MPDQQTRPLPVLRWTTRPSATVVYCLPYAGGVGRIFQPWASNAPSGIEIRSFVLPGRQERLGDPMYTTASNLADDVAAAVLDDSQGRPFAFFGHSMGALIAFETARALRRRGGPQPVVLSVSGREAPQAKDKRPPISHLPDGEFASVMVDYGGMPRDVLNNQDLLDMVLPALRADFALCEKYEYTEEQPLDCPLLVFSGADDPMVEAEGVRGWSGQTTKRSLVQTCAGDHFFLWQHQATILDTISRVVAARVR
jgi:medium-chain acyl-[acyl-carrier-protein] hydrolase